jgi:hypothetical protein
VPICREINTQERQEHTYRIFDENTLTMPLSTDIGSAKYKTLGV